ncbi:MAG TPA: hypothetical protein VN704_04145, partial [Verrucomicrobiae bacterium]|nr:hypothetical protein [Verrucomicrobiae bacterium]
NGLYDTSFINNLKYYSDKNTEIAAAIFFQLPKKINYLDKRNKDDHWLRSKYLSYFISERNFYHNDLLRWFK